MECILKYFTDFSGKQLEQFRKLETVYSDWNEKINVISRKDMGNLCQHHFLHSLSIAAVFSFQPGMQILDLGTGGGFPGIPLAIFYPDSHFHLVDSIAKKLKVVEAAIQATGLTNVSTEHIRAEAIPGRKFDFVVSRAVAPLKELWRWSRPLLKNIKTVNQPSDMPPGLICLKGGDLKGEISESGTNPRAIEIKEIFPEDYFAEKYLLYICPSQ